jgi:hypothetical protein
MSIWIQLLFLHGHIATPRALAGIVDAPQAPAPCAAQPPDPPANEPGARSAGVAIRPTVVVHHPLRVVSQLP